MPKIRVVQCDSKLGESQEQKTTFLKFKILIIEREYVGAIDFSPFLTLKRNN